MVPIPSANLEGTAGQWLPFIEQIAEHSGCHVDQLVSQVMANEVHLILAWEPDEKKTLALCGTRIVMKGENRIGEIVWCTGSGREHWFPLLEDIERYHKDHLSCSGMNAIARPGWTSALKARGYRLTHVTMSKEL